MSIISPLSALILGIVEGISEYLPISSTGHLILAEKLLGLPADNEGVEAFTIVIQGGAIVAMLGVYAPRVMAMIRGLMGRDSAARALFIQLFVAFLPAALVGLEFNKKIKAHLFGAWPVIEALAVGGVVMILFERRRRKRAGGDARRMEWGRPISEMTIGTALFIGVAQCLAMWPGTSRSMVTILAALALGFSPAAAAEFSFLLALLTLGAATGHDFIGSHKALMAAAGPLSLGIGFVVSGIVAWVAVAGFLAYIKRRGLEVFGWYRLVLAGVAAAILLR